MACQSFGTRGRRTRVKQVVVVSSLKGLWRKGQVTADGTYEGRRADGDGREKRPSARLGGRAGDIDARLCGTTPSAFAPWGANARSALVQVTCPGQDGQASAFGARWS